jgi:hypothetical protein
MLFDLSQSVTQTYVAANSSSPSFDSFHPFADFDLVHTALAMLNFRYSGNFTNYLSYRLTTKTGSQFRCWSSGLQRRVDLHINSGVSVEHTASIIRAKVSQRYNPEDLHRRLHHLDNLKCHFCKLFTKLYCIERLPTSTVSLGSRKGFHMSICPNTASQKTCC